MGNMASSGAGRFGRGWGGVGSLQASTERERGNQITNWADKIQREWYEPLYSDTAKAWTAAATLGHDPEKRFSAPTDISGYESEYFANLPGSSKLFT